MLYDTAHTSGWTNILYISGKMTGATCGICVSVTSWQNSVREGLVKIQETYLTIIMTRSYWKQQQDGDTTQPIQIAKLYQYFLPILDVMPQAIWMNQKVEHPSRHLYITCQDSHCPVHQITIATCQCLHQLTKQCRPCFWPVPLGNSGDCICLKSTWMLFRSVLPWCWMVDQH